jgi:hypothetical protein
LATASAAAAGATFIYGLRRWRDLTAIERITRADVVWPVVLVLVVAIVGGHAPVLVALLYVPSWTAIRVRGVELRDELFPLTDASDAAGLLHASAVILAT